MALAPFVDTANYYGKTDRRLVVSGGMDTSGIDNYREGVSVRESSDVFRSNQAKFFASDGNQGAGSLPNGVITHEASLQTFGQAPAVPSSTPFVETNSFNASSTVVYMLTAPSEKSASVNYVNNGAVSRVEAVMLGVGISKQPASLELGEVSQTTFRTPPGSNIRPFLETGAWTLFLSGGGTARPSRGRSVADNLYSLTRPFRDEAPGKFLIEATQTQDLVSGSALSVSELQSTDMKSSGGGAVAYYGGNAVLYGTDSIAFVGTFRGS